MSEESSTDAAQEVLTGQPDQETVTAAVLVIGDEILSGRTKDTNTGYIAEHLTMVGIRLREVRVVPDVIEEIVAAVNVLRRRYDYVLTTGGIGPTHDDLTADAIAAAFGARLEIDERALALMRPYYERRGLPLTPTRLRMARIPVGAELIPNRISAAPGFLMENVAVLAGVPSVMQVMLDEVLPRMRKGRQMLSASVKLDVPEGDVADLFAEHQLAFPDVAMGSYPSFRDGRMRCELVLRSVDAERLSMADEALRLRLLAAGISPI